MKRLAMIDAYRGFALVNMIAYHGFYDWVYILSMPLAWFSTIGVYIWQQFIVFSFVLISGLVFNYAKHPRKRGMILCFWGFFLTICTYFFVPQELIVFGILSFLGSAMLITSMLGKNNYTAVISFFCVVGFLLTEGWQNGYWGFYGIKLAALAFNPSDNLGLFILGIPGISNYSADYVPIFPWIFVFWLGFFGGQMVNYHGKICSKTVNIASKDAWWYKNLAFLGRHTLIIYLLHQPILYFLLKNIIK